jgi:triacylglycerol esterase/lipase EstA (alpha/beta hydrolase family)
MAFTSRRTGAAAVAVALALALLAAPGRARGESSLSNPPPGANNWACVPSAAHPDPVVLVHGLGATMSENWFRLSSILTADGYCVFALTYGLDPGETFVGGVIRMEDSAPELAAFVDRVLAATGASKVDIVGHSEGTVMPRYYLKHLGGDAKVNRFVALTPLYQGTTLDGIGPLISVAETFPGAAGVEAVFDRFCGSCREFLQGSSFLDDLNQGGGAVAGVTYTNVMSRYDELVTPYTSGYLNAPGATNIVLQDQCRLDFAEHVAVAFDPVAAQDVLNALDPVHAKPVPCTLVLPFVG